MTVSGKATWWAAGAALSLSAVAVGAGPLPVSAASNDVVAVRVETADASRTNCLLRVRLKNAGTKPLVLFRSDLPWATRHSLLVVLVPAGLGRQPFPEALAVDDPPPGETRLEPGQSLEGAIHLTRRFPDLATLPADREVICFWSYQLKPIHGRPLERMGGHLVIPAVLTQ